jgi:hypothetical protein
MAKADFTKVEKALEEGLSQMTSQRLLEEAAAINPAGKRKVAPPNVQAASVVLKQIKGELHDLEKADADIFKKIGMKKSAFKKLLESSAKLTPEEWTFIKEIRTKVEQYKRELAAKLPQQSDEEIVKKERVKHINKRFNVREKWLPLQ